MRDLLRTDLTQLWNRLHWAIQLPFVLALLAAFLFLCALGVMVLVFAFERSLLTGLAMIAYMIAFGFLLRWLDRPKTGSPDDGGDDDDPGAGGIPMRLKPPPPTLHARDCKEMDDSRVA